MTKHLEIPEGYTPGPWKLSFRPQGILFYARKDGREIIPVALMANDAGDRQPEYNGLLIALAPEMAAEIKRLREENGELRKLLNSFVINERNLGDEHFKGVQERLVAQSRKALDIES